MITENTTLSSNVPVGCGCAACQGSHNSGSAPTPPTASEIEMLTTSSGIGESVGSNGQPVASMQTIANYLSDGFWSDTGSVSRQFSGTVSYGISNNYSAAEKANIRLAFDLWSDIADVNFTETTYGNGNIDMTTTANSRAYSQVQSWFNSGEGHYVTTKNFITIDTSVSNWWDNIDTIGANGFRTAMHEIGHALGLGHAGNYNAGNGSPTYQNSAQWANDTRQFTIMSYWDASNYNSADHWNENGQWQYASTPMVADMLAIQSIYGADMTTRTGDTTYGFNTTADVAGRVMYDFSQTSGPVVALWDAGGIDTLDVSGYSVVYNQVIDLRAGYYSSVGAMTNNVGIAVGATIENAVGGIGNDTITGNDANNNLQGGLGNDTFFGSEGNDTIDGGDGNDTVNYADSADSFAFTFLNNVNLSITHLVNGFTDILNNIETFIFNNVSYTFNQLQDAFGSLDIVGVRMLWGGNSHAFNSDENTTTSITAADMGYGASTGQQFTIVRNVNSTTVTVNDENAADMLRVFGSDNDDTILVNGTHGSMMAQLYGGLGNDTITVNVTGSDRLYGGAGDDTIRAGAGNDRVYGEEDNDMLYGEDGSDLLYGQGGDDTLYGGNDNDRLLGGDGNDVLDGGSGDDRLEGGDGNDIIHGGLGNDKLFGHDGTDTINGNEGGDLAYGMNGEDVMNGGAGNDKLYGGNNDDTINGNEDHDALFGEAGNDTLNGDAGSDRLAGGTGNDRLNGGAGNDTLFGEDGDDTLVGGDGVDSLYGMDGSDVFGFVSTDGAADRIEDFSLNGIAADSLNITDLLTDYTEGVSDINNFVVLSTLHSGRTDLFINADGSGSDWSRVAIIRGSDFTGTTVDDLFVNGQLIANETLV